MDKSQYIGITETSDPCFHLELFDRLYDGNIIVTKNLSNKLIEKLIENKDKCILHCTCTGMGGSKIEPFVPTVEQTVKKIEKLIDGGFPVKQIVLRIDPIVPTAKGVETAKNVLKAFQEFGIERVRISFIDMYKHVKEKFEENNIKIPYEGSFHAPENIRQFAFKQMYEEAIALGYKMVLTCGEPDFEETPCISQMDIDILGLTDKIKLIDKKGQRSSCGCPSNKRQLITWEESKKKCGHECLYCYMKNDE